MLVTPFGGLHASLNVQLKSRARTRLENYDAVSRREDAAILLQVLRRL